jgi:hypothetical protein
MGYEKFYGQMEASGWVSECQVLRLTAILGTNMDKMMLTVLSSGLFLGI